MMYVIEYLIECFALVASTYAYNHNKGDSHDN